MELRKRLGFCLFTLLVSLPAKAEFAYFGLEPDIVTNYLGSTNQKLGYVRVTVELMLEDSNLIEVAEHHSPYLRSKTIELFGSQSEDKVKSLTGREEIRLSILKELRRVMNEETGSPIIKDIIFTKYLYQG